MLANDRNIASLSLLCAPSQLPKSRRCAGSCAYTWFHQPLRPSKGCVFPTTGNKWPYNQTYHRQFWGNGSHGL